GLRPLIAVAVVALTVGTFSAAWAASPSSSSIGPSDTSASWTGKSFLAGSTPGPSACPPSVDPNDVLCDHFTLTSDASSDYWTTHTGSMTVSISWASGSNNFDLYVYASGGPLAAS